MLPLSWIIAIISIVVIIIVYLMMRYQSISSVVIGYYRAPDEFARDGGLRNLDIIITDVSYLGRIDGIIMADDDIYPVSFGVPLSRVSLDDVHVTVTCDDSLGIPRTATLSVTHGRLILEDADTVYLAAEWLPVF